MYDCKKVLSIAESEVGYLEKLTNANLEFQTANAGKANFTKYAAMLDKIGFFNGKKNGYAWCASFVCACFVAAYGEQEAKHILCLPDKSLAAACKYFVKCFKNEGRFSASKSVANPGDIIFFGTPGDESHVGIVKEVKNGRIYTIEGNTSGASDVISNGGGVCLKSYPVGYNKISGFGKPRYNEVMKAEQEDVSVKNFPTLKKGSKGEYVTLLQNSLLESGYSLPKYGADGDFGGETLTAVKQFQKDNSLEVDGIVGKNTWNALMN